MYILIAQEAANIVQKAMGPKQNPGEHHKTEMLLMKHNFELWLKKTCQISMKRTL